MTILEKLGKWGPFSPNYPNISNGLKQVAITQPSDCLGTWITPHSMWNMVTLDCLLCASRHDLGYFDPVFLNCLDTCKISITQPVEGLNTRVKANLMGNVELKTLDYFSCVISYDLGVFGSYLPKLP